MNELITYFDLDCNNKITDEGTKKLINFTIQNQSKISNIVFKKK